MAKSSYTKNINIFMKHIYNKEYFKLSRLFKYLEHRKTVKKFKRDINEGSPSFNILWQMADFIKLAESVFFYKNTQKNNEFGLFSSKNYSTDTNGFRVTDEVNGLRATIKLLHSNKQLMLEIEYLNSDISNKLLSFTNNEWDITPTIYEEMLLEQIIKSINSSILKLFDSCYDKR